MSSRQYHRNKGTQGVNHIEYDFSVLPQGGTTPPLLGEGDPNSAFLQVQRGSSGITGMTGMTGTYVVTTNDPFFAVVSTLASLQIAGQAGGWSVSFGVPFQNLNTNVGDFNANVNTPANPVNNSWTIPFTVYDSTTATDLPLGSKICLSLTFRNGLNLP